MTLRFRPQRTAASSAKMIDRMSRFRYGQVQRRPRRKFFIRSRPVLGNGPGPGPQRGQTAENVPHVDGTGQGGFAAAEPLLVKKWFCGYSLTAGRGRGLPRWQDDTRPAGAWP